MKRISEIENRIRDCQIRNLTINWSNSINIQIEFLKENMSIHLILKDVIEFDVLENEFKSYYISQLKCLTDDKNEINLSLDPYDEKIDKIEERDNFKIRFKSYEIETKKK